MEPRYDTIGQGYATYRTPDPRIAAHIHAALGDARTIVNVGAGSGSYEPTDRAVVAVEPSVVMARQRPAHLPPATLCVAERLPFADASADAVMGVLTLHHWSDVQAGIAEAIRVARKTVILLTVDPDVAARMWLLADYLPDVAARDAAEFPAIAALLGWLGPRAESRVVPVPSACTDGFLLSFWDRPERVLDTGARRATSAFARLSPEREAEAVEQLAADLRSGVWERAHGALRELDEYDAGLRLVVAHL